MEDLFKALGDALNPTRQVQTDNDDIKDTNTAFHEVMQTIQEIPDVHLRIKLMDKLTAYISKSL
jgi:hypothetical protein